MNRFTGYRIDLEPRESIYSRTARMYSRWRDDMDQYEWETPKEIDPREWFELNNQGNVGSCQGQSLTDCVEMCHVISHGAPVQLSRCYAYLDSQRHDNLIGSDTGSTLDGGTKCARNGLPLESDMPYVANYNTLLTQYRQKANSVAKPYTLKSELMLPTWQDAKRFLGTWQGAIHIGIMWTLKDQWEHKQYSFSSRSGGHAVSFVGYLPVSGWPGGIGFLMKNSWGPGWGRNGYGIVHPNAYDQMFRHQWNIAIGRSDMPRPKPRVDSIDHASHTGIAT